MPNVAALGLSFDSGNAGSKIEELCKKFDKLAEKSGSVQKAFDLLSANGIKSNLTEIGKAFALIQPISKETITSIRSFSSALKGIGKIDLSAFKNFETIKAVPSGVAKSIADLGTAALGLKTVNKRMNENVKALFDTIATFKPIPGDAISSIRTMTELFRAMGSAGPVGSAAKANMQYTDSLSGLYARADAAAIAMRSLQGAFSVRFMVQASKDAADFGTELAYIKTLAQDYDLAKIGTGIMDFSSQLGNATKNAKAFYYAYSAGMRGTEEDLLRFTEENAKLAKVIRSDVIPTMNATTAAINAYGLSARDIGQVSDVFSSIVKYGKASGEQLASGLGQVISTAATAGLSLDEMGASVASLTKVMQTRNAITYFNNMLSKMIKPTKATQQEAEKLGIEFGLNALRAKGFAGMMQEIHDKTQGAQDSLLRLFPDLRGQRAALQLLNKGWDDFQQQLTNFQNKAGETDREFSVLTNDINAQIQALPQTFEKIVQESGKALLDLVTLGGTLTPVVAAFNNMGEGARKFFGTITAGISVYGTFKALNLALMTYQALQARNEQILNAQKVQKIALQRAELKEKARAIMAAKAEAAARTAETRTNALNMIQKANLLKLESVDAANKAKVLKMQAAMMKSLALEAEARGNNALALKIENSLLMMNAKIKGLENQAANSEALALQEEAAARVLNAKAAEVESAAVSHLRRSKLGKAVIQPIKIGIEASLNNLGFMKAVPGATMLARVIGGLGPAMTKTAVMIAAGAAKITGLGAAFGSVGKSATSLFASLAGATPTFAGLASAGAAAGAGAAAATAAAGGLALGTAALGYAFGNLMYKIPFVKSMMDSLAESLINLFTGTFTAAEARNKVLDIKFEILKTINDARGTADAVAKESMNMWKHAAEQQMDGEDKLAALNKRYESAVAKSAKNSIDVVRQKEKELMAAREVIKQTALSAAAAAENRAKIQQFQKELDILRKSLVGADQNTAVGILEAIRQKKEQIDAIQKVLDQQDTDVKRAEEYKKKAENLAKELLKAKDAFAAAQNEEISASNAMMEFGKELMKTFQKMRNIIDEQNFKMMDPVSQRVETGNRFTEGAKAYFEAIKAGNYKLAEESINALTRNYDSLWQGARKKIEENKKVYESIEKMQFDALLMSTKSDAGKYDLYQKQMEKFWDETTAKRDAGDFSGAAASYQKVIESAKQMIGIQNKLAQAEKQAYDGTMRMVLTMDKLKSNAVDAVDAFSVDAVKLQARSYDTMPVVSMPTMQSQTDAMNQKLADAINQFAKDMKERLNTDTNKTQDEQVKYDKMWKEISDSNKKNLHDLESNVKSLLDKIKSGIDVNVKKGGFEVNSVRV